MTTVSFELSPENYKAFVRVIEQARNTPFTTYPVKFAHNMNDEPTEAYRVYHDLMNIGLVIIQRFYDAELEKMYGVTSGQTLFGVGLSDIGWYIARTHRPQSVE